MDSFMSWVGGKKTLRDAIIDRFPLYYERYIEVFGGAGWVLFRKPPGLDILRCRFSLRRKNVRRRNWRLEG